MASNGGTVERERSDSLREVDRQRLIHERLIAMGVDVTLPWLPLTDQLDLFHTSDYPAEALGRGAAPSEG